MVLGQLAAEAEFGILHVARDDTRLADLHEALSFFAPDVEILSIPSWDCLPYDRVSPNAEVAAQRIDTLARLASESSHTNGLHPRIVLTTASALLQRVPARATLREAAFRATSGELLDLDGLAAYFARNGYIRAEIVREPGQFAMRGGILDVFPPGIEDPLRLDFFGDTLERIRLFDPATQRSMGTVEALKLEPAGEVLLDENAIARFRSGYRALFGTIASGTDPLYAAVSEGRRFDGMEHWLPLFHDSLETLFDYLPQAAVTLDYQAQEVRDVRIEMIADHFEARQAMAEARKAGDAGDGAPPYRPVPPQRLYLDAAEWDQALAGRAVGQISPFAAPEAEEGPEDGSKDAVIDLGGRRVQDFAAARTEARARGLNESQVNVNVFDAVGRLIAEVSEKGQLVVIATFSQGSRDRLAGLLSDHGVSRLTEAESWTEIGGLSAGTVVLIVLGLEHGFTMPGLVFIGEQDILGDRMVRPARRRQAEHFIADVVDLAAGEHVVHLDHGIGRFDGLETLTVTGAPHDCLRLIYDGGDRLYLPVENLEVLSRYGSAEAGVTLDKLGSVAWQGRKARLKKRLRDMADQLIRVAAQRTLAAGEAITAPPGMYEEFCARFPYGETEDQLAAIDDTMTDLGSGRSMDRLICGDVGFGKTEVALRAAFATVMAGGQVAVVVPTTLLARQHFATFRERFEGIPVRIAQLSRLVGGKEAESIKTWITEGSLDIVIGTHALLGRNVSFKHLGLLIIDEEQHFGVAHKERLKSLKANVHVLTLTATPIPRTLQLALSGVKEMSIIATPPVDRLAVRTYVLPYDPVVITEAIRRERLRGGQVFYVCPRIEDLDGVARRLAELVPEAKLAIAHGRLPARTLEAVMAGFYEGASDVLLSTQIIESGLDIPTANTLIVHRADMFGLAQLYQLRGRIGRSKRRAYAYLTLPPRRVLSSAAEKRLQVMQALDALGAGFTLASHDLDIRGAGNLLGEEQSGHIREVGVELYQHLLEEAVAEARGKDGGAIEEWTPQIQMGMPVLIPEEYVSDLGVRLGLYRRIARLIERDEIDSFAAEMIDRFGPLPEAVENLLQVMAIKRTCREAGVEKIEVGPKGAVVAFHDDQFAKPEALIAFITSESTTVSLRPDHRLVYRAEWDDPASRIQGAHRLLNRLAELAA